MSLTYTWTVEDMKRNFDDGGVFKVSYVVWAADAEEKRYSSINGEVNLTPNPESESFVAYEDLTENAVLNWVLAEVNQQEVEDSLKIIWDKMYPSASGYAPDIVQGLPWAPGGD